MQRALEARERIGDGRSRLRSHDVTSHAAEHTVEQVDPRSIQIHQIGERRCRPPIGHENGEAERRVEVVRAVNLLRGDRVLGRTLVVEPHHGEMGDADDGPAADFFLGPVQTIGRPRRTCRRVVEQMLP